MPLPVCSVSEERERMKTGYISHFEGYNSTGHIIFNGNGTIAIEHDVDEFLDPEEVKNGHIEHLLKMAKEKNNQVTRIVIVGLFKV
ncbi:hypothetical protein [Enterobacter hormaechei]|uniref:hypothetical protein n=1 Tax=Enterobacter hormaechei TaxID=158836 RepID=UPI0032B0CF30